MYKPKMFIEAEESTAPDDIIINLITFLAIFCVISLAEAIIPAIVMTNDLKELANSEFVNEMPSFTDIMTKTTELAMKPFTFFIFLLCTGIGTLLSMFYCRFIEARHISSMGFRKEKVLPHYGLGLVIGIGLMTAIVGISLIFGINTITICPNINFGIIALYLIGFLVQGMSEEAIFRGFLMNTIGSRHGTVAAVAVSSVAFGLAHLMNKGFSFLAFLSIALFGVFAALYMIYFDDIWGACAIHSIWNFTQGSLYGISVSGNGTMESIFRTTAKSSSDMLTGGRFGIEGSIITILVLCAGSVIMLLLIRKKAAEIKGSAEIKE